VITSFTNNCSGLDCGTAVNAKSSPALSAAIQQFASANCYGCPPTAGGSCGLVLVSCVNGQCTVVGGR
jgi:hypothetical protein